MKEPISPGAEGTAQEAPYADLQVPDEPGVWFCARHKNVKTRLRCGRCEKPICPKCTVYGPTGARCRDCISNRGSHMYKVSPLQLGISFIAAMGMGAVGAVISQVLASAWLLALIVAPAVGPVLSQVIARVVGGKRGPILATVVSLGVVLGALICAVAWTWVSFQHGMEDGMEDYAPVLAKLPPQEAARLQHEMQANRSKVSLSPAFILMMALFNLPLWAFLIIAIITVWAWLK